MQFQPLEVALSARAELDAMIGHDFALENWWNPAWLPLFHNGGGDYIAVDAAGVHAGEAGHLLMVYHDWEYRPVVARDLTAFAQAILAYLETTRAGDMDEFHLLDGYLPETGRAFEASGPAEPLQ